MQKAENAFAHPLLLEILLTLCYNDTVKKYRVIPEKEKEMKKRIFALLVAAIMVVSVLALASCDVMSMLPDSITSLIPGLGDDKTCDTHTDANGDEKCDNCGASVPAKDPNGGDDPGELPEEPDRDPTFKITFNYHGTVYENKTELVETEVDGEKVWINKVVTDSTGAPVRVGSEKDVELYMLDVLENQAPTAEQLAEIPGITYGGITVVGWYDSPALENEFDFTKPLTGDVNVYAKLKIFEKNKDGIGYCGDGATWNLTSGGLLTIDGRGAMYDFAYPELAPWYFNENGERNVITRIEIKRNITHIGANSFYYLSIRDAKSIEIGNGVTSIGAYAFAYSHNLNTVPITDKIEVIGNGAFEGCRNLAYIVLPDSVRLIDGYAFYGCDKFTYVVLGTGLESIGENAFNQGDNSVHEYIYYRGTAEQYANVKILAGNTGFSTKGAYLYFYVDADSPEAKTAGQYWTYNSYGNPKELSYTIRYYAADGNAFPILTDFVLIGSDNTATFSEANKANMEAIVYRGYKFDGWTGLDVYLNGAKLTGHVTFNGIRGNIIGDNATYDYNYATQTLIIKGNGITWDFEGIGDTDYSKKTKDYPITTIIFEDGITGLGANVLGGIPSIVTIEIPATITYVHPKAFAGSINLAAIYYMGDSLDDCLGLDSLVETNANAYAKADGDVAGQEGAFWADKADGVRLAWSLKDGILTIGGDDVMPDFEEGEAPWLVYDNVKEIVFGSNIRAIGANAFRGLKSVEKITLHSKLVTIPRSAFENSAYWNNDANWQDGALMAGEHLLAFDASKMPEGVTYAVIPQATKIIVADAFKNCGEITELVLPAYINSIDSTAFDGFVSLKTIYYYGQNVNAWNTLPEGARNDLLGNGAELLYRATNAKCAVCKGSAVIPCDSCGEKINPDCNECLGSGADDAACTSCGKTINSDCAGCSGNGIQCTNCGGTGIRPDAAKFWRMVKGVPTTWDK